MSAIVVPMQLYAPKGNIRTDKVLVVANHVGLSLEVVFTDCKHNGMKTSPFVNLPQLKTANGFIAGSNSIIRFFANMFPQYELYGRNGFEKSQIDNWMDVCFHEIEPLAHILTTPCSELPASARDAAKSRARESMAVKLAVLENHLQLKTFLVGERLSIADIATALALRGMFQGILGANQRTQKLPATFRWFMTCSGQPSFLNVLGEVQLLEDSPLQVQTTAQLAARSSKPVLSEASAINSQPSPSSAIVTPLAQRDTKIPELYSRQRMRVVEVFQRGEAMIGSEITVCGWSRTTRTADAGKLLFVELNDGSCMKGIQIVATLGKTAGFEEAVAAGGVGASFRVQGVLIESPAAGQAIEIQATQMKVYGSVEARSYPLAKKRHTTEYLRDIQHLRPRTNLIGAVTRVRNAMALATHTFFQERGFLYIHTPLITCSDCEGAGEMFAVTAIAPADPAGDFPRTKDGKIDYKQDFFGRPASLTVSGQLQVEAFSCSMCDVYTFGPTFRAERSHTSRHLAEFWMIEPEIAFADLEDDMNLAEDYLKFCTQYALDHCADDLKFFDTRVEKGLIKRLQHVVAQPFKRLTYTEAIDLLSNPKVLKKAKFEVKPVWGIDLGSEHERYLTEKMFKQPVILTDYPKAIKAFYMRLNDDNRTVRAMDVLVPKIGEIVGGSQREERIDVLEARMREGDLNPEDLSWYLDLRRFGTAPHSGFGLGFERLLMYVTGVDNIRDVIPFPRYPGHADI